MQQLAYCSTTLSVLLLRPAIEHATQVGEELLACGGTAMQVAGAVGWGERIKRTLSLLLDHNQSEMHMSCCTQHYTV